MAVHTSMVHCVLHAEIKIKGFYKISKYKIFELFKYMVIQKDGLNFVHLYFLNYTWYMNDLYE